MTRLSKSRHELQSLAERGRCVGDLLGFEAIGVGGAVGTTVPFGGPAAPRPLNSSTAGEETAHGVPRDHRERTRQGAQG